jgi:rRNA maturation protein Nop10
MIQCENTRCNEKQYFTITVCTACGKKIKHADKQIEAMRGVR